MVSKELEILDNEILDLFLYCNNKKYPSPFKDSTLIINQLKNIEKKLFPKGEQMDFAKELKSSNSVLIYGIEKQMGAKSPSQVTQIIGYLIYQFNPYDKIYRLIKVAVDSKKQAKGLGTILMNTLMRSILLKSSTFQILLHVDPNRENAVKLYSKFNFNIEQTIEDYYGNNRSAHLMKYTSISI